jgi:hypothetical protein
MAARTRRPSDPQLSGKWLYRAPGLRTNTGTVRFVPGRSRYFSGLRSLLKSMFGIENPDGRPPGGKAGG